MKKRICLFFAALMLLTLAGCARKTLHCDACGKEVQVRQSSNMEEDWIIYCDVCSESLDIS